MKPPFESLILQSYSPPILTLFRFLLLLLRPTGLILEIPRPSPSGIRVDGNYETGSGNAESFPVEILGAAIAAGRR